MVAIELARVRGYEHVYRRRLAKRCKCAESLVSYHYSSMSKLRDAIIAHAIETEDLQIIAQGFASRHPLVLRAPEELKRRAIVAISTIS